MDEDDNLYDDFGNFIGDLNDSDAESVSSENSTRKPNVSNYMLSDSEADPDDEKDKGRGDKDENDNFVDNDTEMAVARFDGPSSAVVLHEDKQYYPSAEEVFGPDVETLVQDVDEQDISVPIIAPVEVKSFSIEETNLPQVTFERKYLTDLMHFPEHVRNISIVGQLHSGKTSLIDMLILETHPTVEQYHGKKLDHQLRYTDNHILETQRGISIKTAPVTLLLPDLNGKSHVFNILDTPGHVDFADEVAASIRLADGVVVVIDVIEGLGINTKRIIEHTLLEKLPMVLIINKIDRLILELKLPINDAYYKIRHSLAEVNQFVKESGFSSESITFSPELGNVSFASTSMQWIFSLNSFAKLYIDKQHLLINREEFAKRLWGDVYYNPSVRKFSNKAKEEDSKLSFIYFILEPLYKIYSVTISQDAKQLKSILKGLGVVLKPSTYKLDMLPLLREVCLSFFGNSSPFGDMIVKHLPSPIQIAKTKLQTIYRGPIDEDSEIIKSILKSDENGPVVAHVTKLINASDSTQFFALARVFSGTLRSGQDIKVLGEGYTIEDEEDMVSTTIKDLWISETRYKLPIDGIPAGNIALISGIDESIVQSSTIYDVADHGTPLYIFNPIRYISKSILKVSVEPFNPSELPKLLDGLRKINKSYPVSETKVEESGEHIIVGSGELYMDCLLHDLRKIYAEIEIKVSDPVTKFSETCIETSMMKCYAETTNKKNKITIIAEPLDTQIADDIEKGAIDPKWPSRTLATHFQKNYDWDLMAARSIWAFGPDGCGPNTLIDDTLPTEVDKKLLFSIKDSIKQGFQWAVREGPLCEEPIRNTQFKIMDVSLASEPIYKIGGQIIPTIRRACYSSFLLAEPKLMEPVYSIHATCPGSAIRAIGMLLEKRRGHIIGTSTIAGTPLSTVTGLIPVMDSIGFETDVRVASQGLAFVSMIFDKWQIVPGDPLDKNAKLIPLRPSPINSLAKDFVLKTRRRKGLSDEPRINKYLDESLLESLKETKLLDN